MKKVIKTEYKFDLCHNDQDELIGKIDTLLTDNINKTKVDALQKKYANLNTADDWVNAVNTKFFFDVEYDKREFDSISKQIFVQLRDMEQNGRLSSHDFAVVLDHFYPLHRLIGTE
jgi:hypothetical protein